MRKRRIQTGENKTAERCCRDERMRVLFHRIRTIGG